MSDNGGILVGYATNRMMACLIFVGLLGMVSTGSAVEDTWEQERDMPEPRFWFSTSVVNGKIYIIGGTPDGVSEPNVSMYEYDPATGAWTRKADMPTPRVYHESCVVDGKIYVIGGGNKHEEVLPTVEAYDPVTNSWARKVDMPTPRILPVLCAVDGKIYAIGSQSSDTGTPVEVYDPATNTWTKKADAPTKRWAMRGGVVNGKLYVIAGTIGPSISTVEEYDPVADTWTRKADIPTPREFHSVTVVDRIIYAIGGAFFPGDDTHTPLSSVEAYDPGTDTWTEKADMPTPRVHLSVCAVKGKIYAFGGAPTFISILEVRFGPVATLSTMEVYDTGFSSVEAGGKLATTWGEIRQNR